MWIRRRYRRLLTFFLLGLFVLALVLGMVNYSLQQKIPMTPPASHDTAPILPLLLDDNPLSLDDYTKVKVGVSPGKIYLVDNCTAVVVVTSMSKTFTIQRALEGALDIRPDAYDTIYDLMDHYGIAAKFMKISQEKEGLFYAQLFVEKDQHLLNLDTKPTDALAIATRFHVPIYVQSDVLKTKGERVC